jgi:hypothetical protein
MLKRPLGMASYATNFRQKFIPKNYSYPLVNRAPLPAAADDNKLQYVVMYICKLVCCPLATSAHICLLAHPALNACMYSWICLSLRRVRCLEKVGKIELS